MPAANADQCCTVRLPQGLRDEVVAATGQPFSRIMRFMCQELLKRKRAEIAAGQASANPKRALQEDIAELPNLSEEEG